MVVAVLIIGLFAGLTFATVRRWRSNFMVSWSDTGAIAGMVPAALVAGEIGLALMLVVVVIVGALILNWLDKRHPPREEPGARAAAERASWEREQETRQRLAALRNPRR